MNQTRPDIIEILEMEKQYHADQIRRINVAIMALKGNVNVEETTRKETPPQKTTKPIQWTSEIKDIYKTNDELTIEQVRNKLIEKGIVEAMEDSGRNSIYSTFSRLKKVGYLEQVEYGKYRKKQPGHERLPRRIDVARRGESKEGSELSKHSEPSS